MFKQLKEGLKYLLDAPDANSRFVFLIQGMAHVICAILLTLGFLYCKTENRDLYPMMITVVSGGGLGAALGRAATKWAGPEVAQPLPPAPVPQPITVPTSPDPSQNMPLPSRQ